MSNQTRERDETDTYTIDHATFMLLIQLCGDTADLTECNCCTVHPTGRVTAECNGDCTHSMALQALQRLQEAHERNDPHCTCNACLAAHAARQTPGEAGQGEIPDYTQPSACEQHSGQMSLESEDDPDAADRERDRATLRCAVCGCDLHEGICPENCVQPADDDGQREVMIEQLEQWADDLQTNAPGAVRGVIAGMREVAADLKRGAK